MILRLMLFLFSLGPPNPITLIFTFQIASWGMHVSQRVVAQ
jgi:hypothetical protein